MRALGRGMVITSGSIWLLREKRKQPSASGLSLFPSALLSFCEIENASPVEDKKEKLYDEEWEKTKMHCPLCRCALKSPCKAQFIAWAKCYDLAGDSEEEKESCFEDFKPFIECASIHQEHFLACEKEDKGEDREEEVLIEKPEEPENENSSK